MTPDEEPLMPDRVSTGLALGCSALLLAGCRPATERATPATAATPAARASPAGVQRVTLHVPGMTKRLDLA